MPNPSSTAGNNSSWFGDEAFQVGESGGSADLPQSAEISNVDGLNSPGSAFADFWWWPTGKSKRNSRSYHSQHGHSQQPKNSACRSGRVWRQCPFATGCKLATRRHGVGHYPQIQVAGLLPLPATHVATLVEMTLGLLDRSLPQTTGSNWAHPSGSGGSGGSGDRPNGYPIADIVLSLDPGGTDEGPEGPGTDEAEPPGDEQHLNEPALPTGLRKKLFTRCCTSQCWILDAFGKKPVFTLKTVKISYWFVPNPVALICCKCLTESCRPRPLCQLVVCAIYFRKTSVNMCQHVSTCVNIDDRYWSLQIVILHDRLAFVFQALQVAHQKPRRIRTMILETFEGNMSTAIPEPKSTHSPLAGLLKSFANDFFTRFPQTLAPTNQLHQMLIPTFFIPSNR